MSDITPIYVKAEDTDQLMREVQYMSGLEYEQLEDAGVRLFGEDSDPLKTAYVVGWLRLRRDHPELSYKDSLDFIRLDWVSLLDAGPEEATPADPTSAGPPASDASD